MREIMEALAIAQATEVVEKKEGGLDAFVEQGGKNLSGGQRQRRQSPVPLSESHAF